MQEAQARHEALEKEHEDLLICLAEQEEELRLKERMLTLGLGNDDGAQQPRFY
jgi:hypothetical protein